jgi:hypothetical protein
MICGTKALFRDGISHTGRKCVDAALQLPPGDGTCFMVALRIIEASANGVRDLSRLKRYP